VRKQFFPEPRRSSQDDRPSKPKAYATSINPTSDDDGESLPNSITKAEFFALRAASSMTSTADDSDESTDYALDDDTTSHHET
jgi:hypothetical protein